MELPGIGNLGQWLQQAQHVQAKLYEIQEEAGKKLVEGSAGGGMVTIVMNGKSQIVSIKIDPALFSGDARDLEMLQDLIVSAANDAIRRAQTVMAEEVAKMTREIGIKEWPAQ